MAIRKKTKVKERCKLVRLVGKEVMDRYGCEDCADSKWVCGTIFKCEHQECPYKELDEYQTYEQFLDSFHNYMELIEERWQ